MSRYGSADVGFLIVDGMNILGDTTDLEDNREAVLEEVTALGDAWAAHAAVGVKRYELSQQGFYNDAENRSNAALVAAGASGILCFAPEGNTLGKKCISVAGVQADYKRQISRGALHKASASYKAEEGGDDAIILHALGAQTADGDTEASSYDGTAQSSAGGVAYLQVTAIDLDGYDDVTITILDDADNSGSFGTLQAFTDVSAIGAQRIEVSGTVERYLAVSWAFNGTGTSPSITFMVAFKRN